ncbi:hypothetical protein ACFQS1_25475 [Paractinoplanes rhizophilus]|jgi:hypothetical protein|uniref:Uncharacterized protein n=1 Tax=Paractinoplanes rhizophilus TaxID=1416877 RepID=A0ABW2HW51_9ACTN|nr:hypothetical protein [Actinoplanes sp.]
MRVTLVQDAGGDVVAVVAGGEQEVITTLPGSRRTGREDADEQPVRVEVRIRPEHDQSVHDVELPAELAELRGVDLLHALRQYRIAPGDPGEAGAAWLLRPVPVPSRPE